MPNYGKDVMPYKVKFDQVNYGTVKEQCSWKSFQALRQYHGGVGDEDLNR